MIQNKEDYLYYLAADSIALGGKRKIHISFKFGNQM